MIEATFNAAQVVKRFERERRAQRDRDVTMQQLSLVRQGKMSEVAPSVFPDSGPWQEPVIANMIDVAARDTAEMIAPLPTISCRSAAMVRQADQDRADKRTKIVQAIVTSSNLQVQMYTGADDYATYGFLPGIVERDGSNDQTMIRLLDPRGCYYTKDRFGRVLELFSVREVTGGDVCELYPDAAGALRTEYPHGKHEDAKLELLSVHNAQYDALILICGGKPIVLSEIPNRLKKCMARVAERPGEVRGQYDDVLWVQLAKAQFAMLGLQAAHDAVNAPIAVPDDVSDIPLGPGAVIPSVNPAAIGKVDLNVPREVYTQQSLFDSEQRVGSRYPEVRTGNTDSSVITGRGVQALMGTMDTQIRTAQAVLARLLVELFSLSLEHEERVYGKRKRVMNGDITGVQFKVEYVPVKDINGDYTVGVQYGLMAGLDPNRWLVFGLQAMNGGLVSKDYVRRQMPTDLDPEGEEKLIDLERLREASFQAFAGYAQAIPVLAQQGQDPGAIMQKVAEVIKLRERGKTIDQAISEVFPPPEPAPEAAPGMEGGGGPGGGLNPSGLMTGVAPGQAGEMAGGRPDLQMMLSKLQGDNAQMSVSSSTRKAF